MLRHLRIVAGDERLARDASARYFDLLRTANMHSLILAWQGDPYRSAEDHLALTMSPQGLKRGRGGSVDFDFALVLQDWHLVHGLQPSRGVSSLLKNVDNIRDLLATTRVAIFQEPQSDCHPLRLRLALALARLTLHGVRARLEAATFSLQPQKNRYPHFMKALLRTLTQIHVHQLLVAAGVVIFLCGIVSKVPGTSGGEIVLRDPPAYSTLALGVVLLLLGIIVTAVTGQRTADPMHAEPRTIPSNRRSDFEHLVRMKPPQGKESGKAEYRDPTDHDDSDEPASGSSTPTDLEGVGLPLSPNSPDYARRIEDRFHGLSQTQKFILSYLYRMVHATEVSVDDLADGFNKKYTDKVVQGGAEMRYRLLNLSALGFVQVRRIGSRTSKIMKIPEVGTVLLNGSLLDS